MNTRFFALLVFILSMVISSAAQQTLYESMQHDGVTRDYIVYIPEMYDGNSEVPLMFNFHGYTMSAEEQMNFCDMRSIADTAGFILIYPEGTLFWGATHWNVGSWTAGSTADDIGFTEAMIDALAANYNIDLARVYACGFSNGGYFSFELACKLSDRIAAIGSVGGTMSTETFNSCNPMHPMPIVTVHGTADGTVNYNGGSPFNSKSLEEVNDYWLSFNSIQTSAEQIDLTDLDPNDGSTVKLYDFQQDQACTGLKHYQVNGGGHTWPGYWGNMDIDAGEAIWNFVSQYDLNGLISCGLVSSASEHLLEGGIAVYPNPSSGIVTIECEASNGKTYTLYSMIGEKILTGRITTDSSTIDLSDLPSNIYYLQIENRTIKLIKTN